MTDDTKKSKGKNKGRTLALSTLFLILCIVVISFYCLSPVNDIQQLETYMVNFDSNGGSAIAAIEINEGEEASEPEDPTREGYVFICWTLKNDEECYDFSLGVTEDISLEAKWQELEPDVVYYTVSFDTGGGTTIANQAIAEGSAPVKPEDPVLDGYTFVEWQIDGVAYDFISPITSDSIIVAVWEENEEEPEPSGSDEDETKYTLKLNFNSGSKGTCSSSYSNLTSGTTVAKATSSCTPSRSGYTFQGWSKTSSGSTISTSTKITSDLTLYAIWKKNSSSSSSSSSSSTATYNLNLNFNGGSANNCKSIYTGITSGTTVAKATNNCTPTRSHYTFQGWYTSASSNTTVTTVTSDIKLYAHWVKKSYTISATLITDGTTSGGYKFSVNAGSGENVVEINICISNTRCYTASEANSFSTNKVSFYDNMVSCTVVFDDSNEEFECSKG